MGLQTKISLSVVLKPRVNYTQALYKYGPQVMNISHPLTRASRAAELAGALRVQGQSSQQKRRYGSYKLPTMPRIPRPKRSMLYYSLRSARNGTSQLKLRLPSIKISKRLISTANQKLRNKTVNIHRRFFSTEARLKRRQRRKFIKWWTLTSLTIILGGVAAKIKYEKGESLEEYERGVKPQSWQVAYSSLPLKTLSRMWGQFNSINLPVWFRAPSYKLYSRIFGVNLDEMEEPDLTKYSNLSEFFYRRLKPGVRPIADSEVVSPSDGKVLKFGVIHDGEIEQVKGMTYSIDALLGLKTERLAAPCHSLDFDDVHKDEEALLKRDEEFAKINGISYSLDDILGGESEGTYHLNDIKYQDKGDGTASGAKSSLSQELSVAQNVVGPPLSSLESTNRKHLYFAVIYLAPGDYHRFHSPVNWVATLRRHFIGELFSVAPFFQKTLQGLFVLNERVALLGYWKHGFFSMVPVGATNVGSIVVNFDKYLKTNDIYEHEVYLKPPSAELSASKSDYDDAPETDVETLSSSSSSWWKAERKRLKKNTVYEATYSKASRLLGGYPLAKGQEVGGFKLGSTVVLVFEAPDNFKFDILVGQKVKMGQSLGAFE